MEQIVLGVKFNEPVLLVGETGTGKTTTVQELSNLVGTKLHVFNLSQSSDSTDLLGGYKPINTKILLKPIYE
jgi:midasin